MGVVYDLLHDVEIPKFYKVTNHLDKTHVEDPAQALRDALKREGTMDRIKPGSTVCFPGASREIANSVVILRTFGEELRKKGCTPYIIPGMGSHGGATAEGQRAVLEHYGITEESTGCKIISDMKTEKVGVSAEGLDVHLDAFALSCDYIVPIGRIKPHTDFRGEFESGIMKMLAIGMAKQHGASSTHKQGFGRMAVNVPSFGRVCLANCNIPFGIGLVENAFHQTYSITAIPNEKIEEEEPGLLRLAKSLMPVVPFEKVNVLVVEQIGKEISGDGMDTNVTGRSAFGETKPFIDKIAILDLSPKTGSNFMGIGAGDATTRRVMDKANWEETLPNAITSLMTYYVRMPAVMDNDKQCVQMCLRTSPDLGEPLKTVWIKDTLHMEEFYVSTSCSEDIKKEPNLTTDGVEYEACFDENGAFAGFKAIG